MPHSHHSHSGQYCSHATDTLDAILARAANLGFRSYGLTEHVPRALTTELYPEEIEAGLDKDKLISKFKEYLAHARKLQHQYDSVTPRTQNSIEVLVGCETESTDGVQGNHLDFFIHFINSLSPSPSPSATTSPARIGTGVLDYIVGSVHHIHNIPIDFDQHTFTKALQHYAPKHDSAEAQHRALMEDYLDAQFHLLQRLRPEVVGHFDLCRLYAPDTAMRPSDSDSESGSKELQPIWSKVERNVRFAASYGALFEINSASFRKGWKTAYPGRDILELILSLGGRICLSDDSHGTHQVGQNYTLTRTYLLSLTPSPPLIWYLRRRRPIPSHEEVEDEEEELARVAREQSERPGANAPTLFGRGTQAVPCWEQEWAAWPGWQKMQEQEAEPTASSGAEMMQGEMQEGEKTQEAKPTASTGS